MPSLENWGSGLTRREHVREHMVLKKDHTVPAVPGDMPLGDSGNMKDEVWGNVGMCSGLYD